MLCNQIYDVAKEKLIKTFIEDNFGNTYTYQIIDYLTQRILEFLPEDFDKKINNLS